MTEQEIFEQVKKIIVDKLSVKPEKVTMESKFVDDLGADSLYLNEIVYEIEDKFKITVPDEAFDEMQSVGQAIRYVMKVTKK
ncbi:MAG TPA: acyl carrier protein [Bacillota bacterium]|nr:acyl carrier protein [Bacillota bacterium]HOH10286.1 acyl carrier protein [Bacillota bacterium]HOS50933.1 acyl carrier protein [Bacillota bacterium]HPI01707.1 acyl carrier protein [Bacillota bacterium]HPM63899.1 acyl carrier protein [Bacillota bacterium]